MIAMRSFACCLALAVGACAHSDSDRILERAASLPPGQTEMLEIWLAENPERSALRAAADRCVAGPCQKAAWSHRFGGSSARLMRIPGNALRSP